MALSLLFLSLICLELFATVSATRPPIQRTPRRYSHIKRKLDTRISGLLIFGRQGGPCCSDGECCDSGEFCNLDGCCLVGSEIGCLDGGCCFSDEFCDFGGCCPIGEFCTGPPPPPITISNGGGGGGGFTPSDTSFPSTTHEFSSSIFTSHSSFSVSSGAFGGPTPFPSPASSLPAAGSITPSIISASVEITPFATPDASSGNISSASASGFASVASRAVVDQPSMFIAVAILSLSGYYL